MENRLPVGPGSRGGHWHELEFRRQYYRDWKHEHYGYREREAERKRRSRWLATVRDEQFGLATFTEACLEVVRRESADTSANRVSKEMAVAPRTVTRWLDGSRQISGEGVDAIIATYGLRRVLRTRAEMNKEVRRHKSAKPLSAGLSH